MVKFNILGSCVCRDIFNHGNSNFQVNKNIKIKHRK